MIEFTKTNNCISCKIVLVEGGITISFSLLWSQCYCQTRIQKFLGSFFGPSFGHYGGKGWGLDQFQKFWGSFGVVLR